MTTKQIIHNSLGSAEAEQIALNAKVKHLHKGTTLNYHSVVKHPTQNKWATRYIVSEDSDSQQIKDYWQLVEAHLNPNQIGNLVDISNDWKAEEI